MDRWNPSRTVVTALCALTVLVSTPAWTGDWIYDDWNMRENPAMDGVEDLLDVFHRSSRVYFQGEQATGTYRPLSMASLIAVWLVSDQPLLHHLVSLALHLTAVGVLFAAARAISGVAVASWVALVFALHPAGIEAYGWINGRSDVLAGVGLSCAAYGLFVSGTMAARVACVLLGVAVTVLAKETGILAIVGLLGASLLPVGRRSDVVAESGVRARATLVAVGVAVLAANGALRRLVPGVSASSSFVRLELDEAPRHAMRLLALASESLLNPAPRTMPTLAHTLYQPMSLGAGMALFACAAGVCALWWARRWRALGLVITAGMCLGPCLVLRHAFWHGFDRYLYMPMILVGLGIAYALPSLGDSFMRGGVSRALSAALALMLGWGAFFTARTYASQPAFLSAMIELRPEDPCGYLMGVEWLYRAGNVAQAEALLQSVPEVPLAPAVAFHMATLVAKMGHRDRAIALVDATERRHPKDPHVLFNVVGVRMDTRDLSAAMKAAKAIEGVPMLCDGARDSIERAFESGWSVEEQARARRFVDDYRCAP